MFDVSITGDTAHIDTIFNLLPHTRQNGCINILHCCNDPCLKTPMLRCVWQEFEYRIYVSRVIRDAHIEDLYMSKKVFQFSCGCEQFHYCRSFGFILINICNHGEHYGTPYIVSRKTYNTKLGFCFIKY
jgi:hypothetical protein